ncbi:hypothetical protein [Paenibacillus naphthalenovorans]|uniref:Phosphohydrolase n=1 Tax=Paenibacillus naphthalenovorans TaxID=162209 RepID=A0A0U2IM79_9BACL|nr:hypothetical protein [Paenibacillus naphthalenovorans]ALS22187.1 hypothetical protein IJ22_18130 [Paenibacillus naphthalenovorans]
MKIENRVGDWIETYTGKKLYPLDPRTEEICIKDIAHALSLMTRFNGHGRYFYSVAQHSLNVMFAAESDGHSKDIQLKCLLHDASEAYIADIVSPAKRFMPEYKKIEEQLQNTIWKTFGIEVTEEDEEIIKFYDLAMLGLEAKTMMYCKNWDITNTYLIELNEKQPLEIINLKQEDMEVIESRFLSAFNYLMLR